MFIRHLKCKLLNRGPPKRPVLLYDVSQFPASIPFSGVSMKSLMKSLLRTCCLMAVVCLFSPDLNACPIGIRIFKIVKHVVVQETVCVLYGFDSDGGCYYVCATF